MNLNSQHRELRKRTQFIRFLIVGTVVTAILYGIYFALHRMMNPSAAYTVGFVISFVANYLLTSLYTFQSRLSWKKAMGFSVQQGVNYLIQLGFLNLFLWFGVSAKLAPFPVFIIILPINFLLLRFVFKNQRMQ